MKSFAIRNPITYETACVQEAEAYRRSVKYLENVIRNPQHWHNHQMAIQDAISLVQLRATLFAEYVERMNRPTCTWEIQ